MFDCHTHTNFSSDSELDILDSCEAAITAGLSGIAITDHLDLDYPGFPNMFHIDFDKYSKTIDDVKAKYANKLVVLKGIEIGMQPHVFDDTLSLIKDIDLDFVIGSLHIVKGEDPYLDSYFTNKTQKEAHRNYLEEILKNIKIFNDFDVLGHIDYVRRYGSFDDKTLLYHDHMDIIDEILKQLIHMGKGMEINAGGFRYKLASPLPDIAIYKRFKELGGEIITIGTDAHSTEFLGKYMLEAAEFIKSAGFSKAAYFVKRKPIFYEI